MPLRAPGLVAVLLALPLASGSSGSGGGIGPFVGMVTQGETDAYLYDNNPSGRPCIDLAATYTVTLSGAPVTDTLTLAVAGKTVDTVGGVASVSFWAGVCARFVVSVTGTDVAGAAIYGAAVASGPAGGLADPAWG